MFRDLQYAVRGLRKAPALSIVAIASLALGLGANVTVYSVAREMVLDDISASRPEQLARVDAGISYAAYRDLRRAGVFAETAFNAGLHDAIWERTGRNEVIWGMDTSPNFFDVLGIAPASGRLYTQRDEGRPVAVVSYGFWSKRLQGASTLEINGRIFAVLGVLPHDYRSVMGHGVAPEIYAPLRLDSMANCRPFGRMRDGMTRRSTREALASAVPSLGIPQFQKELPALRPFSGLAANAGTEGDQRRMFVFFLTLIGVAAILALVACSNVAGLLLARRISRQREMAIRQALGANRWQLTRPLLAEAAILVACGAGVGLVLDAWLRGRLSYLRWPTAYNIPFEFHFQSDRRLFLYALAIALAAVAVCSWGGVVGRTRWNLRGALVGIQVVFSMVLLVLGALFTRGFLHLANNEVGFDARHIVIATVHTLKWNGFEWHDRMVQRARQVPGVLSVTSTDMLPLMGEVEETTLRRPGEAPEAARPVYDMKEAEAYFTTMGIPILRGRDFDIGDRERKPTPAIVNATLVRQFFGGAEPIGAHLVRGGRHEQDVEIVGVAADSKMRTLGEVPAPAIYTPDFNGQLLVRVAGDPAQWIDPLRRVLTENDAAPEIRPMRDAVAGALFPMQVAASFVGSFSALGLLLALVGVYGSVSFAVSRRTREMGIRSALGATAARIVWTAMREGAIVVGAGSLIGLVLAISAVRPLVDLLPTGVDPWEWRMFAAMAAILIATGLLAAAIPARRAARVDPAVALRQE